MKPILYGLIIARALDVGSSCIAFRNPSLVEKNPYLMSNCKSVAATVGVVTTGEVLVLDSFAEEHPKLVKVLGIISIGISSAAVMHNIRQIRK